MPAKAFRRPEREGPQPQPQPQQEPQQERVAGAGTNGLRRVGDHQRRAGCCHRHDQAASGDPSQALREALHRKNKASEYGENSVSSRVPYKREREGGERVVLTHLWAHPMEAVVSQRCGAAVRLVAVGVAVAAPRPPN